MADPKSPPHPPGAPPDGGGGGRGATVLERAPKTKKPRMFQVILHNDDYTTMEFVVWILETIFHKSPQEAVSLMLEIHEQGRGIAGVFTKDVAETLATRVVELAEANGMPLLCTVEPESGGES